jgi:hypothetical protein
MMLLSKPQPRSTPTQANDLEPSNGRLLALTLFLVAAICLFHLASAVKGHPLYRDQHVGTALEYYKHGIDLLKPVIVGFNATGTPTPLEVPLWQAMTAEAFKMFGPWYGWGNVVSLILFFSGLFPLYQLARSYFDRRCAWWTLIFFLAQPLIFIYAGEAGTDGFSIASSIWFLFFAVKLLQTGKPVWWVPTCLVGAIAAVSKLPFFMAVGLTCFFLAVMFHRKSMRPWILLGTAGIAIVAMFFAWTGYSNRCLAQAEFPVTDLRLSNPETVFWYFGDLHYRLSPGNWIKGAWRILNACFGSFVFLGLPIYSLFSLRSNAFAKLFLLAACVTTMVFTHLVLHHEHYYLMFSPAFALLCGHAAASLEASFGALQVWKSRLALPAMALLLGLSVVQGLIGLKVVLEYDSYPHDITKILKEHTTESDKLLIEGGGWGGQQLLLTNRKGLTIWNTKFLEDKKNYDRLKGLGYDKLVMISESPLLTALQKVNPGQSRLQRVTYETFLTPVAKDWPTVYQDENILIKDLP